MGDTFLHATRRTLLTPTRYVTLAVRIQTSRTATLRRVAGRLSRNPPNPATPSTSGRPHFTDTPPLPLLPTHPYHLTTS